MILTAQKESIEAFGCVPVSLDELLEQADFASLHVRLSPQTQNMFGAAEFAKMKPTAIFVMPRAPVLSTKPL